MTKSRKVGIALALTLLLALFAASILPLTGLIAIDTANAVTVTSRNEWVNSYTGSYYDNLNVSTGTAFRSELANLITSTHKHETSYSELATVFKTSDADPKKSGNIIWFYTGTSTSFSGSFGSSVGSTNREHVWAKNGGGTFPAQTGPGSDAHHLRPTEMQLNGYRSNYGFSEVAQNSSNLKTEGGRSDYGSTPDELCYLGSSTSGVGGTFFYPAKGYRGATARILMYVQVRWGDDNNLYFLDTASTSDGKGIGRISDLMKWHLEEPPTDEEIRRNEAVFKIQGNRNPFIDHPEYAELIYCNDGKSYNNSLKNLVSQYGSYLNSNVDPDKIPTSISLSPSSLSLTVGDSSSAISVSATPSTASNEVTWKSSNTSVATVSSNGVVKAVSKGTATITATSKYDTKVTASLTVTVNAVQLTGLTLSRTTLEMKEGAGTTLTVTPTPSNASADVTWTTSDASVATVSAAGYVTAKGAGTATITATSVDFPSVSASATVTVVAAPKPTAIEVTGTPNNTAYAQGEEFDPTGLSVKVTYDDGSSETFTSTSDLLANFEWLDGVTGQTTLSIGTTTVICRYGDLQATVTGITVANNIDNFLSKMEAIDDDDFYNLSLEEQFDLIKQAVAAYNRLTATEKNSTRVVGKYSTLRDVVEDYNEAANAENNRFQAAITLSASAIRAVSTSFAALIAIVKGLLGR